MSRTRYPAPCVECGAQIAHTGKRVSARCEPCRKRRRATQSRERYERNREDVLARMKAEYHADPVSARATKNARYAADPERARARARRYREQHIERIRELDRVRRIRMDPDARNAYIRDYYARHPEKVSAMHARRAAAKNRAPGNFSAAEFAALCERFGHRCLCCGATGSVTADHVVPLSWGGSNDIANIQPLCRSCNSAKGNRHATDYRNMTVPVVQWAGRNGTEKEER